MDTQMASLLLSYFYDPEKEEKQTIRGKKQQ